MSDQPASDIPKKNPGGRPRKEGTIVVNVRMPLSAYDRYCQVAIESDQEVRTILRQVLTRAAETLSLRSPKP